MSYQKRKLKKSKLSQLKYKLGLVKITFLKKALIFRQGIRSIDARSFQEKTQKKESQMFSLEKATGVLKRYDRLPNNPDISRLEQAIINQLQKEGLLRLCVFVCPKFNTKALFSATPENYMPVEAGPDLFDPRITKILSLKEDLLKAGLPTEISLIIGDNDAEEYIFPFMESFALDVGLYRQRQSAYCSSLEQRCRNLFGDSVLVWSLAENGIAQDKAGSKIPDSARQKEIKFFKWLFSADGPYRGALTFPEEVLTEMVRRKYKLYGAQGWFLETLGGILLQTEGPGVWLERTEMLRSTGSAAIPAIYPWIRKEEIRQPRWLTEK